ncbi:hypothetical protein Ciccas_013385, partial [Cichlidogyrus casuarinus]
MTITDYENLEMQQNDMILLMCTGLGSEEVSEKLSMASALLLIRYCEVDQNLLRTLELLPNPGLFTQNVRFKEKLKIAQRSFNWMRLLNGHNWEIYRKIDSARAFKQINDLYKKRVVNLTEKAKKLGVTVFDPKEVEQKIAETNSIDGVWQAATDLNDEKIRIIMTTFMEVMGNTSCKEDFKLGWCKQTAQQMLIALIMEEDPVKFANYAVFIQYIMLLILRLMMGPGNNTETEQAIRAFLNNYKTEGNSRILVMAKPPNMAKAVGRERLGVSACHVLDMYRNHQLGITGQEVFDIYGDIFRSGFDQ